MHVNCHFDAEDEVTFRLVNHESHEPFVDLAIGDSYFYLNESQLVALRMVSGQALIALKDAQDARTPKLTADEDGHSLRADQFDNEQERVA